MNVRDLRTITKDWRSRARRSNDFMTVPPSRPGYAAAYRGDLDHAFELLAKARRWNFGPGVMANQAMLGPLHSDARGFLSRTAICWSRSAV